MNFAETFHELSMKYPFIETLHLILCKRIAMGEFPWEKLNNSKEKIAMEGIPKGKSKGTNPKGNFLREIFQRENSSWTISMGNGQREKYQTNFRWANFNEKNPKGKFQRETSNWRCPMGKVQRVDIKGRIPMEKFQWENTQEGKIPKKGNVQWDNSKGTHTRKQA